MAEEEEYNIIMAEEEEYNARTHATQGPSQHGWERRLNAFWGQETRSG